VYIIDSAFFGHISPGEFCTN